ncbi:MAG: hypothetical protein U0354_08865 [Candidatus Sericytochromatia bacterium]
MSKSNMEILEKRLKNIRKGAYFSGLIGYLSILLGLFLLILSFNNLIEKRALFEIDYSYILRTFGSPFLYIIYGWVFIFLKDAFESIETIISEISEIV